MGDERNRSGQILDGKYQIERELGRGGMGTVYLATHFGTERPVAVKIISPQYMKRAEFVERFRREARAAGRLRHPNVVDVTDFGFADMDDGRSAYLVMEYLDGCTLGEILDEERNLPVSWSLDILDQVCSAVHEAHIQGIIHRDLKPDNIWLEPNQRGGYTVKVLDFGIAKLEEHTSGEGDSERIPDEFRRSTHTVIAGAGATFDGDDSDRTIADQGSETRIGDGATAAGADLQRTLVTEDKTLQLDSLSSESATAILQTDEGGDDQDTIGTRMIDGDGTSLSGSGKHSLYSTTGSAELTRVGAVLGTPLYMSPEQCRGERLDARSDIYSLGVIAYQMLSGDPPFTGDYKDVMEAHKTLKPPSLRARGVRRKMKRAIHQALSKEPDERPRSADAFASVLRSRSEGLFALLRRSLVIYSEHLPKFLALATFFELPVILLTLLIVVVSFLKVSGMISDSTGQITIGAGGAALTILSVFCATLISGTIAWIVAQYLAVPLRPIRLRPALREARSKAKRFAGAALIAAITPFTMFVIGAIAGAIVFGIVGLAISPFTGLGWVTGILTGVGAGIGAIVGFFIGHVICMLITPVVMMENVSIRVAFRRSRELVRRSFMTALGASILMFLLPMVLAGSVSYVVQVSARAFDPKLKAAAEVTESKTPQTEQIEAPPEPEEKKSASGWNFSLGRGSKFDLDEKNADMQTRVKYSLLESLIQLIWLPLQILVLSFSAIIVALLYLKTRLAGGESMSELLDRFEDDERPRKKWQERVRQRLIQSGRIPSKS